MIDEQGAAARAIRPHTAADGLPVAHMHAIVDYGAGKIVKSRPNVSEPSLRSGPTQT